MMCSMPAGPTQLLAETRHVSVHRDTISERAKQGAECESLRLSYEALLIFGT